MCLTVGLDDGDHRPEDLVIERHHAGLNICEHCRCEESSSRFAVGNGCVDSSSKHLGTSCLRIRYLLRYILPGLRVHEGPEIHAILFLRQFLHHLLLESRFDALLHDGSLRCDANLTSVQNTGVDDGRCGGVQIRVRENRVGVRATELDHGLFQKPASFGTDYSTRTFGSCQGHTLNQGMLQHVGDLRYIDDQRPKEALRHPRQRLQEFLTNRSAPKAVRGMLQQDRIAGHEGGDTHSHDLPHREVPRHDGQDDAERLI
mmetsp:Transcript_30325/g.86745  ORF Transcript_30325/g.86745 Transcript_30325/m.86745 type:complete len:259 (+) Transcript_30325:405-1181(+)